MIELLNYEFIQRALVGGMAISISCGIIGPFLVLRKLALLSDGLAHLSFGGVAFGLLLGINPLISALVAVTFGSIFVNRMISKKSHFQGDITISLILSFGVGLGIIVIGAVRGFGVDLFSYLIGSILALNSLDLILAISLLIITVTFITLFFKQLMLFSFNQELAELRIKNASIINSAFVLLVAYSVVISIKAVGILLISSLLVLPTLISLEISNSFRNTLILSAFSGFFATFCGIISSFYLDLPPSGTIVMILFGMYIIIKIIKTTSILEKMTKLASE